MKFEPSHFVATYGFYVVNGNPAFEVEDECFQKKKWKNEQRFTVKQVVAESSKVTFN